MWPLLTGQNNTDQSQALVILGCGRYIGGTKSGNSFEKHRNPRFRNLESISENCNKDSTRVKNLVETGTDSFLQNQEWDM
jgi:hypothetical protein